MTINIPKNASILVSRTDSIGDVILTIPLTYTLKKLFPENKIVFLCTSYTYPILKNIATIDEIIDYNEISKLPKKNQKDIIQKYNIHTAIIAYPSYEISQFLFQLKIPYRIATSHRWYNWIFCNQLVSFSRKNSDLHEAQLNFHLLKPLGISNLPSLAELKEMFLIKPISPLNISIQSLLDNNKIKIILHPKSKGSAREWGIKNFINLINILDKSKFQIILTGTNNELPELKPIIEQCPDVLNLAGKTSLDELIALINECDALIAASTGTLHIAAMLGKHAIGIFPPIRPMHPGRWAPIGKNTHIFCKNTICNDCRKQPQQCHCIQEIQPSEIVSLLNRIFASHRI
ncbi:MAG: glycosyltransferase family 9 protein [Bacteroidota bacterium]